MLRNEFGFVSNKYLKELRILFNMLTVKMVIIQVENFTLKKIRITTAKITWIFTICIVFSRINKNNCEFSLGR
jgi:hypothetical protein